ncbi:MAG: hypothetical protein R8G34_09690 [Paracoccaceae bacterium]|nr:hypothetical protein [Paracoccaceae bacterium]
MFDLEQNSATKCIVFLAAKRLGRSIKTRRSVCLQIETNRSGSIEAAMVSASLEPVRDPKNSKSRYLLLQNQISKRLKYKTGTVHHIEADRYASRRYVTDLYDWKYLQPKPDWLEHGLKSPVTVDAARKEHSLLAASFLRIEEGPVMRKHPGLLRIVSCGFFRRTKQSYTVVDPSKGFNARSQKQVASRTAFSWVRVGRTRRFQIETRETTRFRTITCEVSDSPFKIGAANGELWSRSTLNDLNYLVNSKFIANCEIRKLSQEDDAPNSARNAAPGLVQKCLLARLAA